MKPNCSQYIETASELPVRSNLRHASEAEKTSRKLISASIASLRFDYRLNTGVAA